MAMLRKKRTTRGGANARRPSLAVSAGRPEPLGATLDDRGANFAVFSDTAQEIEVSLFADDGAEEVARVRLPAKTGSVWHGHIEGVREGQLYGFRAHGWFEPDEGLYFNPAKLLLDPYALSVTGPIEASAAFLAEDRDDPGSPDHVDSASVMPKCVVMVPPPKIDPAERPNTPWSETVLYEAHVKGLTKLWPDLDPAIAGTVEALGDPDVIEHLKKLGITAVEMLPLHLMADEGRLADLGLTNYWGYNTIGFLAPEPRLLGPRGLEGLRETIRRLHAAGIEAILDVVYNHTAEGGAGGPSLSFRGLDDRSYYRRTGHHLEYYVNDTGCGNTVNLAHPMVLRLVLDSLRYWAERIGFDGFRFDLAPALTRGYEGDWDGSAFLSAIRQDPVLRSVKLIAEPWDIGPNGYKLGGFPTPFAEWNDRFRDAIRGFWRREPGAAGALADGLLGSAGAFDHGGRRPWSSVNFVACHDGFTLADLTMYNERSNRANGEDNRDGHSHNLSDNMGREGPTDAPEINERRARRRRNLLATALLAQGAPMVRAGDEVAQSQQGNNNAYCQDNEISWIDWSAGDPALARFVSNVLALRRRQPALRQTVFLHARRRETDGESDVEWFGLGGGALIWDDPATPGFCVLLRGAAEDDQPDQPDPDPVLIALNAGDAAIETPLPPIAGRRWWRRLDTAHPTSRAKRVDAAAKVDAESLVVFVAEKETAR